ncbi:MAG: arginine deiminase [Firmicutes bacterium]|nr:arginine deiminase [Bacillota bacterium]
MNSGIHNYSEIGKLNKVLLHRIGPEVENLVPGNFERFLFDDIPYLEIAQQEHDAFAKILKDNGVEVVYYIDETAKALANPQIKEQFIKELINESNVFSQDGRDAIFAYLNSMDVKEMIAKIISGVTKEEVPEFKSDSFAEFISISYPFYMDPMPNLYFTRDPGACIGDGINIHHMHTEARRRESILLKYIYKYNRDFADESDQLWYDYDMEYSIEGGDVLVLNKETVAIGLSERTTASAIERFANNLLNGGQFKKVIVLEIPKKRAFMHLDTVFTMVDYDKFTIHPEIEDPLRVFEMTPNGKGEVKFSSMADTLPNILKNILGLPAVQLLRCGGDDPMAAQREQWNDGSNTLAIAPGKVITYERNHVTNDLLDKAGITVLTMPSSELSRGRGGPRCMSCPVNREDL